MAVYNPPQQTLFSPVTNYYQGKAMRQQLAAGEVDINLKKKTLEQSDTKMDLEKQRISIAEDELKLRKEQITLSREEFEAKVGKDKAKVYATEGYAALWSAEQRMKEDPEAGLALAKENIEKYVSTLPEDDQAKFAEVLQDGVVTMDEFNSMKAGFAGALGEYGLLEEDGVTLKDHKNYMMPDGTVIMARPNSAKSDAIEAAGGVVAGTQSPVGGDDSLDFEPINAGERAASLAAVNGSKILSDLSTNDKTVAAEMIANDARQLQATFNQSYEEALALAIVAAEQKVIKDPKFAPWAADSKLETSVSTEGLANNEYVVNGVRYIKDENGIRLAN